MPAAAPPRPFFRPWATWLATVLAAGLVGHLYILTPGGPLDHLHRPEDSLERLTEREMEVRAALRHAAPWERRLYALLSGGDESVDDWIRWHEELAQVSTSPDVELSRLILLGETRQTEALRAALDDWEGNDEAETRRKDWIATAYLEPSLSRATGRALITEVRDELPAGWFADALVARLARRSGDAVARQQAESAIAARGAVLLRRWRALEAAGLLLAVAGLAALGLMLLTQADPRVADARMPEGFSLADGYALFVRGALGFLVLGAGFGLAIPDDSPLDAVTGPATIAPILLCAAWYLRSRGLSFTAAFGLLPGRDRLVTVAWVALALVGLQLAGEAPDRSGARRPAPQLPLGRRAPGKPDLGIVGARRARDDRQRALGAARRRGGLPRRALPCAPLALRRGAGRGALRRRLRRRARLRRAGLRRRLLERHPLGAGLRADRAASGPASSRTPPAT